MKTSCLTQLDKMVGINIAIATQISFSNTGFFCIDIILKQSLEENLRSQGLKNEFVEDFLKNCFLNIVSQKPECKICLLPDNS
jgi:hypothetical protein